MTRIIAIDDDRSISRARRVRERTLDASVDDDRCNGRTDNVSATRARASTMRCVGVQGCSRGRFEEENGAQGVHRRDVDREGILRRLRENREIVRAPWRGTQRFRVHLGLQLPGVVHCSNDTSATPIISLRLGAFRRTQQSQRDRRPLKDSTHNATQHNTTLQHSAHLEH